MSEKRSNPLERRESPQDALSKGIEGIKASLAAAPVFAFLEKFDTFAKKKTRVLTEGETLFEPGEDPYFYIVTSGALKIFRINPSGEKKEIGKAYTGSFLGEGALSGRLVKEVEAVAYVQSSVAAFTKEDFDFLESKSPETLMRFYRHLSDLTSLRLADSGKELALLYEMTEKINACKEKGERGTLEAITLLKQSLSLDYIIMVEQHSAVPGLLVYKYNTRFPSIWPINQKVGAELKPSDSGLLSHPEAILWASASPAYALPLKGAAELRGFLILGKKSPTETFSDYELRIAEQLASSFASMVENTQRLAEEKARARLAAA